MLHVSANGRFVFSQWENRRDAFPMGITTTAQGLDVYTLDPDAHLFALKFDKRSTVHAAFATVNGATFLITVEDATKLSVYALPPP
jgi:hypothetical protein